MRIITIMKYLGVLTVLSSAMSTAYAANSGFYVGADMGRDTGDVKSNLATIEEAKSGTTSAPVNGFFGGVHAGYDRFLTQQFVLGTELFWNRSNASGTHSSTRGVIGYRKLAITNSMGASVLPGWQLDSNNRLYARLGWIQSQFNNTTSAESAALYGPTLNNVHSNGVEMGVGYLVSLAKQWDLRMEYDHDDYRTLNRSNPAVGGTYAYTPSFDRYVLGFDYNFDATQVKVADSLKPSMSGWYTGIATGRADTTVKLKVVAPVSTAQENRSLSGYLGDLHVGYGWQLAPHAILGVETFGALNSAASTVTTINATNKSVVKWRENNSFGVSLLPGYQLNATNELYARTGFIESKFTQQTQVAQGGAFGPTYSTYRPGVQLGLGYAVALSSAWSAFSEYDYAKYASIHAAAGNENYYVRPIDNQYKVGFNYHF